MTINEWTLIVGILTLIAAVIAIHYSRKGANATVEALLLQKEANRASWDQNKRQYRQTIAKEAYEEFVKHGEARTYLKKAWETNRSNSYLLSEGDFEDIWEEIFLKKKKRKPKNTFKESVLTQTS